MPDPRIYAPASAAARNASPDVPLAVPSEELDEPAEMHAGRRRKLADAARIRAGRAPLAESAAGDDVDDDDDDG